MLEFIKRIFRKQPEERTLIPGVYTRNVSISEAFPPQDEMNSVIIVGSKNGPENKIEEFWNIKRPMWFQFWKKKKYRQEVEEDKQKFFKIFDHPPRFEETCKFVQDGKCFIDDMTDKYDCTGKSHDLEHCGDYHAYKSLENPLRFWRKSCQ